MFADQPAMRVLEFDLRGSIRLVADLVLEPLDAHRVAGPVGQPARHEETGQSAGRLRENQVRIDLRTGEEPFVPGDYVLAVRTGRRRDCGVGADIGSALLFRHAHAHERAVLLAHIDVAAVIGTGEGHRQDRGGDAGLTPERRNAAIGHGRRALAAGLDLSVHDVGGGARRVGTRRRI